VTGWVLAAALAWRGVRLARRLEGVADAEHELRGALTAFGFVPGLASEVERACAALDALSSGRRARSPQAVSLGHAVRSAIRAWEPAAHALGRSVELDWQAGALLLRTDRGRLAQALGNLIANAVEHGSGTIRLRATRDRDRVRIEVANDAGRGRGLRIAARAVEECGGSLELVRDDSRATAAIELPLAS
jgi:signal transduction histidine kinase